MRRRIPLLTVLATILASGLLLATASFAPAARSCGTIRVPQGLSTVRYSIKVTSGSVACTTAKRVMSGFIHTGHRASGWTCHHGTAHGSRCTAGSRRAVSAYYLGRTGDAPR